VRNFMRDELKVGDKALFYAFNSCFASGGAFSNATIADFG
jgi:predicted RNA-binding protein with PUA-like domain